MFPVHDPDLENCVVAIFRISPAGTESGPDVINQWLHFLFTGPAILQPSLYIKLKAKLLHLFDSITRKYTTKRSQYGKNVTLVL